MAIFGRRVMYRPKNTAFLPFEIIGDFHKSYMEVELKNAGADISSAKIVLFVRLVNFPPEYPTPVNFPPEYPTPLQGDYVNIWDIEYQVIDIEHHIPGSRKLVLQEP